MSGAGQERGADGLGSKRMRPGTRPRGKGATPLPPRRARLNVYCVPGLSPAARTSGLAVPALSTRRPVLVSVPSTCGQRAGDVF